MVSTRRQTQGLQYGDSLALRSRATPGASNRDTARQPDELEQQPAKRVRMTGVVIPQDRTSLQINSSSSPEPVILDSQNSSHVKTSIPTAEENAQQGPIGPAAHAEPVSGETRREVDVVEDSQSADVIQDPLNQHFRFGDGADAEPMMTSSNTFGRSGGPETSEHLTSEESDEEAPPELATSIRTRGQVTFTTTKSRKAKKKLVKAPKLSENSPYNPDEEAAIAYPEENEVATDLAQNDLRNTPDSHLSLVKTNNTRNDISRKPSKDRSRRDIVQDGIIYRFPSSGDNLSGKLAAGQNFNSRLAKESLLKRKRSVPTTRPKFFRV